MRDKKYRGTGRRSHLKMMSILLASVMVLSAGGGQLVLAGQEDISRQTEVSENKEERIIVYLDGRSGDDGNLGEDRDTAVKSFSRAAKLAGDYGIIRISGTVTVEDETWKLTDGVSVRRAEGFEGALVKVNKNLTLKNVRLYEQDITGEGTVEGAVQKEKVYVPKVLVMEEPAALSELALTKCEGDGVFAWENESFVPSEYETACNVVFHPYDDQAVDYSKEKGWDEEGKFVVRQVTVQVNSLKPAEEPVTPEPTPETKPETSEGTQEGTSEGTPGTVPDNTQDGTSETTPEVQPENTPEVKPETEPEKVPGPSPESSPETTPEGTPEGMDGTTPGADPETTPGSTPEITPEAAPETTPEGVPETTPEIAPEAVPETGIQEADGTDDDLAEDLRASALEVVNLIDYLPAEIESPEVVEAVVNATKAYEALDREQKAWIGAQALDQLKAAQEKAGKVNRQCSGVIIEGDFPWYIQFRVELRNDKDDVSVLEDRNVDTFIAPYEMQLWNLMEDCEYKLNGQQVRVTMPAPDGQLYNQLVVIHYLEDGSVEYITPVYNEDGTISFLTTSFSPYNIAGSKVLVGNTDKLYTSKGTSSKLAGNVSGTSSKKKSSSSKSTVTKSTSSKTTVSGSKSVWWNPRTGDEQMPVLYIILGIGAAVVLAIAVLGYMGYRNNQKNKKRNRKKK